jgi:dipeptidyl aminopeptidase/acylaminoacyl peptidase
MTPFHDLHDYMALPRLTGLRLAPDGSWLAVTVTSLSADGRSYQPSIWRLDTTAAREPDDAAAGSGPPAARPGRAAVRLTRSAEGEDSPVFLPDGGLLFLSARPAPPAARSDCPGRQPNGPATAKPGDGRPADEGAGQRALWLLPAGGGEARRITAPPGGVSRLAAAARAPLAAFTAPLRPGAGSAGDDAVWRKARADAGVTAILHESPLVRYWDHDLGPDELRLLVTGPDGAGPPADSADETAASVSADSGNNGPPVGRDLTPQPGRALDEQAFELTPDGRQVVTGWSVPDGSGDKRKDLIVIDTVTGEHRTLLSAPGFDFYSPRVSPDGTRVVAIRERHETYHQPGELTLVQAPLDGSAEPADLLPGLDRWPSEAAWAADGSCVYFTADDHGRGPVFRADLAGGMTRLTTDHGAYTSLCPAPDGQALYALRSAVDSPPAVVRIATAGPGEPEHLPGLASRPALPGRLAEIKATAADGTPVRGWLVLPAEATPAIPAPFLLWVHGGPYSSWNAWSWRWNPWLMAAQGYAVLLPDPGLSTGYGQAFVGRGHGDWGNLPFTDLMTITDAAVARADIDAGRTAAMGGSFGGYMANWIAGHTTRFRAIVSHASLWALDQMFATTDTPAEWRRQLGLPAAQPERYQANSPHLHAAAISTPMLVIHGDKDYRVPVGEALRLWADLSARPGHLAGAKFLYFPDENHWVLTPGNATAWYQTVSAFLAQHVRGEPWRRPDLL